MKVRGWCPSLHEPMASGDGLLVRVKPRGGVLPEAAAHAVAEAALRHGNGVIELTNRANLQIRGLSSASAVAFAREMVALDLAEADPAAERRRNVIAAPFGDLALEMEAMLVGDARLAALPGKFGVALAAGAPGDVRVADGGIALDGADLACRCAPGEVVGVTQRLIHAMLDLGWTRMREADAPAVFARAGLAAIPCPAVPSPPPPIGKRSRGFGFGLPFGQMEAATLHRLAEAGETLHMTPWRAILLPQDAAPIPGLIIDPADPRLRIAACPGSPACAQGSTTTRPDAAWLAARLGDVAHLHVSGCAKGCAHPGGTEVTLVAEAGRYNLVRHGQAGSEPLLRGLTLEQAAGALL
jgi:precorrin-3B synthase